MRHLERILRLLFWLPILLGGIVGFSFVEPRLQTFGIISAGVLGIFVVLVLLQAASERWVLHNSRKVAMEIGGNAKIAPMKKDRS